MYYVLSVKRERRFPALEFSKMKFGRSKFIVALAGGLFFASLAPAFSQSQNGDNKPAEPQKTAEQRLKEQQLRAAQELAEAAKLLKTAGRPECVWAGRRATSLLWRDDIDTAKRYIELYERFGCPADHLKVAFRCVVRMGPLDQKATEKLAARVHTCWIHPDTEPAPLTP